MKNRLLLALIFIPCLLSAQNGYYFFTESDISQIRSAAKTEWGKDIIESLKDTVEARREYPYLYWKEDIYTIIFVPNTKYVFHSTGISRKHITVHNASIIGQGISVMIGHG